MTAGIYCRLSREDEGLGESESIVNQRALLLRYAADQGWQVGDIYIDEDYSGADRDRPAFNRMLRDAEAGRLDIVLVKTQSRFTRDMELLERYVHGLFPLWGVRFVALVDHIDTAQAGGKKARQINGLINEWYLEDLSAGIRAVLDHKRREGDYIGSFALYGYVKSKADRHRLEIDPEAAEVVRRIYNMYLNGLGKSAIADKLNGEGIPNPTGYKQQNEMNYVNGRQIHGDHLWSRTTVGRILREPMYTGDMVQGRRKKVSYKSKAVQPVAPEGWMVVPGTHEAIIDRETFDRVQGLLAGRTRGDGRGAVHPLAGLCRCGLCGAGLHKVSSGDRRYLRCPRRGGCCRGVSVNLGELEGAVLGEITGQIAQYADEVYIKKELDRAAQRADRGGKAASLRREIGRLDRAMERLYLDRVEGIVTPEQMGRWSRDYQRQRADKENHLRALEAGGDERETDTGAWPRPEKLTRALVSRFVRRITVGEKAGGTQEIRIEWLT